MSRYDFVFDPCESKEELMLFESSVAVCGSVVPRVNAASEMPYLIITLVSLVCLKTILVT
jgi:hypothetical protein